MSTTSFSDDTTGQLVATQKAQNASLVPDILSHEELYQRSFMTDRYPLVSNCDLDPWEGTYFGNDTETYKESSPTR